jgi:hypothetical protein
MVEPRVQIVGVYRVQLTDRLLQQAMETKCGGMRLSRRQRKRAEATVRDEISSAVLLEVLVEHADERFSVGDFGQPGSDQAAYDEAYLSPDGTSVASWFKAPDTESLRMVFFLHFFDRTKPLATSYGEIEIPTTTEMPERLRSLISYEPVG